MDLAKLFEMQRKLDAHIEKEHPRQDGEDRLSKKILALQVELGELANEWRGFKFWSNDQEPRTEIPIDCPYCYGKGYMNHDEVFEGGEPWPCKRCDGSGVYGYKNALIEEYADGLHFILSIAIELGYKAKDLYVWDEESEGETVDVFIELMYWTSRISSNDKFKRRAAFRTVCYIYFNLAVQRLGFTWDQIEEAYMKKNQENHRRQEVGY
jgi:dimeric dUTPase (all-alpha-NTP-PPase superfamily)